MKKLIIIIAASILPAFLLATVPGLFSPVYASPGLYAKGISDGIPISVELSPGESRTFVMEVGLEEDDDPLDITAEIKGFGQNLEGGIVELTAAEDSSQYSARGFTTVTPAEFHLEPGETQEIEVKIDVPSNTGKGGLYAVVHVSADREDQGGVTMVPALDIPILCMVTGTQVSKTGEITQLEVSDAVQGQPFEAVALFDNTGNYHYKVTTEFNVQDEIGAVVGTVSTLPTYFSIIPTFSRQLEGKFPGELNLPPGVYILKAEVFEEEEDILLDEATVTFTVGLDTGNGDDGDGDDGEGDGGEGGVSGGNTGDGDDGEGTIAELDTIADLVISSLSPEWIDRGDTYNTVITVKNIGGEGCPASSVVVHIDDTLAEAVSCPALGSGGSDTITVGPFTLSDGEDVIKVCADGDNVIEEENENNNCEEVVWGLSGFVAGIGGVGIGSGAPFWPILIGSLSGLGVFLGIRRFRRREREDEEEDEEGEFVYQELE